MVVRIRVGRLARVTRDTHLLINAKALLSIGLEFREPIKNYIPIDEEILRVGSYVDSNV